EEVAERRQAGLQGRDAAAACPLLEQAIESIASGLFSPDDPARFHPLIEAILGPDEFMIAADFDSYWRMQRHVDAVWNDPAVWWRVAVLDIFRMRWLSSGRPIREYAEEGWRVPTPGRRSRDESAGD